MKHVLRFIAYGSVGVLLTLLVFFTVSLNSRQDLNAWHLADLDEEFTESSEVFSFPDYLKLEDRLFEQLDELVYSQTGYVEDDLANRYKRNSLADPARWPRNWNRSFEMPIEDPKASVLLLHGLSDSPYSLRKIAERLHEANAHVLGLRIPGHGTAPSGLVEVTWQDMTAAVALSVKHLAEKHPGRPIHIVGYSNGAALAVHYTLTSVLDSDYPAVGRLVLISPEIGVTPAAAFAVWQARLGHFLGLEKLAWNSIEPEYDPFKYNSFAINAGDVSFRITAEIQRLLDSVSKAGKLEAIPPTQAFSSVVDATVLAPALVNGLMGRLPPGGHELVLFDVNVGAGIDHLYKWDSAKMIKALRRTGSKHFTLNLVSNMQNPGGPVVEHRWQEGEQSRRDTELNLEWPSRVFSLSHVALPISPGDTLYGGEPEGPSPGVQLGSLALRGERGVLMVSADAMLRLRWNPFYPYLEKEVLSYLDLN